ncbi:MAG: GatB/YqeY domain-containing protein [Rhodothermaceae bacterium]|nr:GatB/YqeY domain-containing protein [Rhodothermaceae bacterium]
MALREQLAHDLKDAMRAKDKLRLSAIRLLQTAITEKEKSGSGPPSEDELVAIVQKQAKQRRDSIAQYSEAGRDDLAQREADELAIIEQYLPPQLSDEDIYQAVQEIVQRTGATSMKDMGRVMGEAMSALRGQADGKRVQTVVRALLNA